MTNQRQTQFRSPQYVTFGACLSVKSPFREHSLNTDLAGDNVLLATPAGSERSVTGANPVCRASFSPSTLEATLTSFGFRSMQVACKGLETWAYYQRADVLHTASAEMFFFFLFSSLHFIYWSTAAPFLGLKPEATAATFSPRLICLSRA